MSEWTSNAHITLRTTCQSIHSTCLHYWYSKLASLFGWNRILIYDLISGFGREAIMNELRITSYCHHRLTTPNNNTTNTSNVLGPTLIIITQHQCSRLSCTETRDLDGVRWEEWWPWRSGSCPNGIWCAKTTFYDSMGKGAPCNTTLKLKLKSLNVLGNCGRHANALLCRLFPTDGNLQSNGN